MTIAPVVAVSTPGRLGGADAGVEEQDDDEVAAAPPLPFCFQVRDQAFLGQTSFLTSLGFKGSSQNPKQKGT